MVGVKKACDIIRNMQDDNNDFVIVISGYAGVGKSTLMMRLSEELKGPGYLCKKNFEKYHVYSRKEFEKKLDELPDRDILCADEAINMMFKREFQNRQQNQIIKKLNTYRNKCMVLFFLLPTFWHLDSGVRNSTRIKWWIHCYKKGEAWIFQHEENPFNPDLWNQKENFWLFRNQGGRNVFKSKNYVLTLTWKKVNVETFEAYEQVKGIKRKLAYLEKDKKKVLTKKEIIQGIVNTNPVVVKADIARLLKCTDNYVSRVTT